MLTKLTPIEAIEAYLTTFERMMEAFKVKRELWAFKLAPKAMLEEGTWPSLLLSWWGADCCNRDRINHQLTPIVLCVNWGYCGGFNTITPTNWTSSAKCTWQYKPFVWSDWWRLWHWHHSVEQAHEASKWHTHSFLEKVEAGVSCWIMKRSQVPPQEIYWQSWSHSRRYCHCPLGVSPLGILKVGSYSVSDYWTRWTSQRSSSGPDK